MLVPNRHGSSNSYRYGFQGQEKDDELKGEGNSLNYTFRMHDPRVGRFFAVDPLFKEYPELTPYQFASNSVIDMVEIEGLEGGWIVTKQGKVQYAKLGPVDDTYFKSYNDAIRAANSIWGVITKPSQLKSLDYISRKPKVQKQQAQVRCNCAQCQMNKYPEHNLGSENAIGNPVFREATLTFLTGGTGSVLFKALPKSKIITTAAKVYNKLTPTQKYVAKVGTNTLSQTVANEGKIENTNIIESLASAAPGQIAVIIGESVTYTPQDFIDGKIAPSGPDIYSVNGLMKWGLQVYGGLGSNAFGNATDKCLKGEKGGEIIGGFMKFNVETISNIVPQIVPETETQEITSPDEFKIGNNE